MSRSLNKCTFIGNLGKDPEVKYLPSGDAVASFSLACGESWTDKSTGEKKEKTEWIRCVAFKKVAEIIGEYLKKGSQVYIEGRMRTREWEKDGVKHYSTEINVESVLMLGGGKEPGGDGGQGRSTQSAADSPGRRSRAASKPAEAEFEDFNDDIPF